MNRTKDSLSATFTSKTWSQVSHFNCQMPRFIRNRNPAGPVFARGCSIVCRAKHRRSNSHANLRKIVICFESFSKTALIFVGKFPQDEGQKPAHPNEEWSRGWLQPLSLSTSQTRARKKHGDIRHPWQKGVHRSGPRPSGGSRAQRQERTEV